MTPLPRQAARQAESARNVLGAVVPTDRGDSLEECAEGAGVRRKVQHLDVARKLKLKAKRESIFLHM
jgi:hypothetical protein